MGITKTNIRFLSIYSIDITRLEPGFIDDTMRQQILTNKAGGSFTMNNVLVPLDNWVGSYVITPHIGAWGFIGYKLWLHWLVSSRW